MPSWALPIIFLYWIYEPADINVCLEQIHASCHSPFGSIFVYLVGALNLWLFFLAHTGEDGLWHLFIFLCFLLVIQARERDRLKGSTMDTASRLPSLPLRYCSLFLPCLPPPFLLPPLTLLPLLFCSPPSCHSPVLIGWNHLPQKWPIEEPWVSIPWCLPHIWP